MTQMSTSLRFDRSIEQMGITQDRLSRTQMQLTTSKQVIKPSDAPEKSAQITRLKSAISRQESYVDTMKQVQTRLSQQESALDSATTIMARLKELTVQAANDTNQAADRKSIDVEVRELRDQLLSLANTQDIDGNYIFSGTRVGKLAFAPNDSGRVVYQGDQTITAAGIGDQSMVNSNRAGTQPFDKIVRTDASGQPVPIGFFEVIQDLSAALQSNDTKGISRAVGEMTTLQNGLSDSLASVGAAGNKIQNQLDLADENLLRMKEVLSNAEDVNYTEAITKMNKDMLALEAAQSSFAKIAQLNLFDYIK